ncbi:hypothetical protein ABGB16_31865 [Micromonospora sp. B11E3]|uniref:hypothetical protein n=1 Tax=Micromonospora sp. B11E3 TaxID=3153562 RepID=UPI00325DED0A
MNTASALILFLTVALAALVLTLVRALTASTAIPSRAAGRRDLNTGRLNTARCRSDIRYLDGAASEYLRKRGDR